MFLPNRCIGKIKAIMKVISSLFCLFLITGCTFTPSFEPDKPTWPKPHKDARSSEQKRADREAVHEQQRAVMRGERPDYGVFDRY
ncbi:AAA family ATPase [Escherichia coli]|nr:AAA family ATPase [Escherichia coli]PCQ37075.1 AAA family ATPase [Providencia rettgeri]